MSNKLDLDKAKICAFRLLKFRMRSEKEIKQRLKLKKFDSSVIKHVITFLKEKDFLDDRLFAKSWAESRIKMPLGLKKLEIELKQKGINDNLIAEVIFDLKQKYSYDEEKIVRNLFKDKVSKMKKIDKIKAKRRLQAYFMRRGFSPDVVIDVIRQW